MSDMSDLKAYSQSNLQSFLQSLRRRKMLIYGTTLLGFSATALTLQSITPLYESHAQIQFKGHTKTDIVTQIEHLKNNALISRALVNSGLQSSLNEKSVHPQNNNFKSLNLFPGFKGVNADDAIQDSLSPQIQYIKDNLDITLIPNSYVLELTLQTPSPFKSASILNKLIALYETGVNLTTPEKMTNYGDIYLKHLKENAEKAVKKLESFEKTAPETERAQETPSKQGDIALKLAEARVKYEAFLDENDELYVNLKAAPVINSALIQSLKLQQSMLEQEKTRLSNRYGHKHPKMIAVDSDLTLVTKQIQDSASDIMHNVAQEYKSLLQQSKKIIEFQKDEVTEELASSPLELLQQEAKEKQKAYLDALKSAQNNNPALYDKKVTIISRPSLPTTPSYPQKLKWLIIGALLSFLTGIIAALLNEKTRKTFLSGKQIEEFLNIPCYALIPQVQKEKHKNLADYVLDHPSSIIAEAVRSLRLTTKLRTKTAKSENKIVTITSSFPNEGKTTLALWMARLAAKAGERVIIIDTDLRRPSVHKAISKNNTLSLVEYLTNQNKLEEIIDTSDRSGAHMIFGRSIPNSALDLLASAKMDQLLLSLTKAYDLIIIDSPACLAVSDARALSKRSDQILYAVAWNKTPREVVHNGISQFQNLTKAQIATILTNINLKKHVELGYGDIAKEYSAYQE